jgi:hypothetical protein
MPPKTLNELNRTIKDLEEYLKPLDKNDFPFFKPYHWLLDYLLELKKQYRERKNYIWKKKYDLYFYDINEAKKLK